MKANNLFQCSVCTLHASPDLVSHVEGISVRIYCNALRFVSRPMQSKHFPIA